MSSITKFLQAALIVTLVSVAVPEADQLCSDRLVNDIRFMLDMNATHIDGLRMMKAVLSHTNARQRFNQVVAKGCRDGKSVRGVRYHSFEGVGWFYYFYFCCQFLTKPNYDLITEFYHLLNCERFQ